jgi:hypothetical protein
MSKFLLIFKGENPATGWLSINDQFLRCYIESAGVVVISKYLYVAFFGPNFCIKCEDNHAVTFLSVC